MKWIMALLFVGAGTYLAVRHRQEPPPPPPVLRPLDNLPPMPVIDAAEFEKVQRSTRDPSPEVRWAAIQLLYALRDPSAMELLEHIMTDDPEPDLRLKAVALLRNGGSSASLPTLVKGLKDVDKTVRVASLIAIGDIGDPASAPWVTEALKDYEPEVRVAALQTLSRFQDQKTAQFRRLAESLRKDYEAALLRKQGQRAKNKEWGE